MTDGGERVKRAEPPVHIGTRSVYRADNLRPVSAAKHQRIKIPYLLKEIFLKNYLKHETQTINKNTPPFEEGIECLSA